MKVRFQNNLRSRVTALAVVSRKQNAPPKEYLDALVGAEGQTCNAPRVWRGPTGLPFAYNVEIDGSLYHVPALFVDEVPS